MSRIVDPILADMRWETGRPRWLGYAGLVRAFALHFVASTPQAVVRVYSEDGHAIPRAGVCSAAVALLFATVLAIPPFPGSPVVLRESLWLLACLLPQGLVVSLPAALLVGIPVALHRRPLSRRIVRRTVGLSLVCAAATFILLAWIMPAANQSFRVLASRNGAIVRGLNETGFSDIKRDIARLKGSPDGDSDRLVRRMTYTYQFRLTLAYSALPLGLIALSASASALGRRRPLIVGLVALGGYIAIVPALWFLSQMFARASALPPGVLAWVPASCLSIVAVVWLAARARAGQFDRPSGQFSG